MHYNNVITPQLVGELVKKIFSYLLCDIIDAIK